MSSMNLSAPSADLNAGVPNCCTWEADIRQQMLLTNEVLESTRIEDKENQPMQLLPLSESLKKPNGQLKLNIQVHDRVMTIHVIKARYLSSPSAGTCHSFVKLSIIPDYSKRARCRTDTIRGSNHPLFDEKFSFELLPEDYEARVLICVKNKERKQKSIILGCMSFGIKDIWNSKKVINGWYYLQDHPSRRKASLTPKLQNLSIISPRNQSKENRELKHQLTVTDVNGEEAVAKSTSVLNSSKKSATSLICTSITSSLNVKQSQSYINSASHVETQAIISPFKETEIGMELPVPTNKDESKISMETESQPATSQVTNVNKMVQFSNINELRQSMNVSPSQSSVDMLQSHKSRCIKSEASQTSVKFLGLQLSKKVEELQELLSSVEPKSIGNSDQLKFNGCSHVPAETSKDTIESSATMSSGQSEHFMKTLQEPNVNSIVQNDILHSMGSPASMKMTSEIPSKNLLTPKKTPSKILQWVTPSRIHQLSSPFKSKRKILCRKSPYPAARFAKFPGSTPSVSINQEQASLQWHQSPVGRIWESNRATLPQHSNQMKVQPLTVTDINSSKHLMSSTLFESSPSLETFQPALDIQTNSIDTRNAASMTNDNKLSDKHQFEDTSNSHVKELPVLAPQMEEDTILKVSLHRNKHGYGLSLTGESPSMVSRVEPCSEAELAGVRVGDEVVRVCGQNVYHYPAHAVGRIIRHYRHRVNIEFHRRRTDQSYQGSQSKLNFSSDSSDSEAD